MTRTLVLLALIAGLGTQAEASSFHMTPDVPTPRGASTWRPNQIVRNDSGTYSSVLDLPPAVELDAIQRLRGGDWLFSIGAPAVLGGTSYDPRDVIRYSGGTFSLFLDGAAAGIPAGSNVDAIMYLSGDLFTLATSVDVVLSFDVPTTIGGVTYDPADLVRSVGGSFSATFDASAAVPPIPPSTNLVAAARIGSLTVMTFDVPTRLGAATYKPGELVAWDGATFSSYYAEPDWPVSSRFAAFTFLADPGDVANLQVARTGAAQLTLSWSPTCSPGGLDDYAIYMGTIGSWYSHDVVDCTDGGHDRAEPLAMPAGNVYFLLVPYNANNQGSYGQRTGGIERPTGASSCGAAAQALGCP